MPQAHWRGFVSGPDRICREFFRPTRRLYLFWQSADGWEARFKMNHDGTTSLFLTISPFLALGKGERGASSPPGRVSHYCQMNDQLNWWRMYAVRFL